MRFSFAGIALAVSATVLTGCGIVGSTRTTSALPEAETQPILAVSRFVPQKTLAVPLGLQRFSTDERTTTFPRAFEPSGSTIYVGVCASNGCYLYQNGHVCGQVSGSSNAQGTISDATSGDWLISNTGASNVVLYDTTNCKPVLDGTLNDPGQYPVDVATIDRGKSLACVAISNIFTTGGSPGSVTTVCGKKTANLTAPNGYQGIGVATDSKGNCYWSYNKSSGGGEIVEFRSCKGKASRPLVTGLGFSGGVAFDGKNDMYYSDQLAGIYACKGTKICALAFSGFTDPLMINFTADFKTLFVADAGSGNVDSCAIGGSCTIYSSESTSNPPFGVAPIPGTY